jgi:hypothetical protein
VNAATKPKASSAPVVLGPSSLISLAPSFPNLCLNYPDKNDEGGKINIVACNSRDTKAQYFSIYSDGSIRPTAYNSVCVQVENDEFIPGASLVAAPCLSPSSVSQVWQITSTAKITGTSTKATSLAGFFSLQAVTEPPMWIGVSLPAAGPLQMVSSATALQFVVPPMGTADIITVNPTIPRPDGALNCLTSAAVSGASAISVAPCTSATNKMQLWKSYDDGTIRPSTNSNLCIDVSGSVVAMAAKIRLMACTGKAGSSQQWTWQKNTNSELEGGSIVSKSKKDYVIGFTITAADLVLDSEKPQQHFTISLNENKVASFANLKGSASTSSPSSSKSSKSSPAPAPATSKSAKTPAKAAPASSKSSKSSSKSSPVAFSSWVQGKFGPCLTDKGLPCGQKGTQTAMYTCESVNLPGLLSTATACLGKKPEDLTIDCALPICATKYLWKTSDWTPCTGTCGTGEPGVQARSSTCVDESGKTQQPTACKNVKKPSASQKCDVEC